MLRVRDRQKRGISPHVGRTPLQRLARPSSTSAFEIVADQERPAAFTQIMYDARIVSLSAHAAFKVSYEAHLSQSRMRDRRGTSIVKSAYS